MTDTSEDENDKAMQGQDAISDALKFSTFFPNLK